jgi:hypothetical protein
MIEIYEANGETGRGRATTADALVYSTTARSCR